MDYAEDALHFWIMVFLHAKLSIKIVKSIE